MRKAPGTLRPWLLLGIVPVLLVWCRGAVAVGPVQTNAPPAWVDARDWQRPEVDDPEGDSEGVRVLLREYQENPVRHEEYVRFVSLLENESGVQASGSLQVSFDPSYETLILHCVRVHRAGRVLDRLNPDALKVIQPETGLWGDVFTGQHTAVLFVEDLRVGDVLECAYTLAGANPVLGDHYSARYLVNTFRAADRLRVRVVWPSSRPLFTRRHRVSEAPHTRALAEGSEYTWDWESVPALDYEDDQPPGSDPYPYVEFSDFDDWSRVVEWARPLYAALSDAPPAEAVELAARWRSDAGSNEEAARRALQFVQDDLRYTGIELGPDSYRPAAPAETLVRRYGDCKAKSLLFCVLVRAMGMEAWPALVNTAAHGAVAQRLPSPFAFDHVIVKLVLDGRTIWVDPTRASQGGTLWDRYLPDYRNALVIREGTLDLEDLPAPGPEQRFQEATSRFVIADYDSPSTLTVTTVYHGGEADSMRGYLAGSALSDVAQNYLNYYSRFYPGITNDGPMVVRDDRELNRLTVVEKYRVADLWELDEAGGQWGASFYPDSLYGMLTDPDTRVRRMPLHISHPLRREHTVIVRLPDDGWDFPTENETIEHAAFRLKHRREGEGNTVRFDYVCETLQSEVPADEVPGYLSRLGEFQDLLGDTLFRPDTRVQSRLNRINWLMVVLALVAAGLTGVTGVWVWRRVSDGGPAPADSLPPVLSDQRLTGLGGWLILVCIGLLLSPCAILFTLASGWESYFSHDVWQEVAVPSGGQYHPLWAPVLLAEVVANIVLIGWSLLLLRLFFGKRRAFPRLYIAFLLANFLVVLVDTAAAGLITGGSASADPGSMRDVARAAIGAVIWGSYMVKSRRVRLTFVR